MPVAATAGRASDDRDGRFFGRSRAEEAAEMYRRFAAEARAVFNRYPTIRDFLR